MAKFVVPPKHETIIKCAHCDTMYVPEKGKDIWMGHKYEECPYCKYGGNGQNEIISLWRYNLIKFFRGGFKE